MREELSALGVSILVFASTNVDDLVLLSIFFADPGLKPREVVGGQFLGIAALVSASAVCSLFALAVPEAWIGLLGLIPLGLGLRGFLALRRQDPDGAVELPSGLQRSKIVAIAGVTIANGGDNMGVYIPLFSSAPRLVPIHAAIFGVMTGIWCAIGFLLVNSPLLGKHIRRWGHVALPFVLVALGLVILSRARALIGI